MKHHPIGSPCITLPRGYQLLLRSVWLAAPHTVDLRICPGAHRAAVRAMFQPQHDPSPKGIFFMKNTSIHSSVVMMIVAGAALSGQSIAQPLSPALSARTLEGNPRVNPLQINQEMIQSRCTAETQTHTLEVVPTTIRIGTPVEIRLTPRCPFKGRTVYSFDVLQTGGTPANVYSYLQGQIARFSDNPNKNAELSGTTVIRYTQQLNSYREAVQLTVSAHPVGVGRTEYGVSNSVVLNFEGVGATAPAAEAPTSATPCRPTLSLNALPSAVIGGALVAVDLGLSCALAEDATVQIITSNANLLPGPPPNTVLIPVGQTTKRFQLTASRTGSGPVTLRAVLAQPAFGGMTPPDSLTVTN